MEQYEPDRLSPAQVAAMRRSFRNGRAALSRRSLLRASAGGALAVGGLGALSACGIPAAGKTQGGVSAEDHSAKEKTINFSNWTEYMDVDDSGKHHPTLDAFTKSTGISVKYTEDINDNVEFFGKIKPQLAAGQDTGRDLIVVTDWLAARLIRFGWVQKLNASNLPHAYANLSAQFRSPDWDPGRAYSYPWQGISTVIAYNKKALNGIEVKSVSDLLDNPKLKGRVGFLSEMRDSMGMTLLDMGKDPRSSPTTTSTRRSPDSRRPSTRARYAASPATTTRPTSPRATSRPVSPGRATSSSSRRTARTWTSSSRTAAI